MDAPCQTIRGRIDELADELVQELTAAGLSEDAMPLLRRVLELQLEGERFRSLVEAKLDQPAQETLDRLVLSFDGKSRGVTLACKN